MSDPFLNEHGLTIHVTSRRKKRVLNYPGRSSNGQLKPHTVLAFLASDPSPVAFIAFDLDLYSSTRDAMAVIRADRTLLLPRVPCYFDDILGFSYSSYTGERLSINQFNADHSTRKLDPIHGLRYFLPASIRDSSVWETFYWLHIFDHPLYDQPDTILKPVYLDEGHKLMWRPMNSDWQKEVRT